MYEGWEIHAYTRKPSREEVLALWNQIRTMFKDADSDFSENTHTGIITCGPNRQKIDVSFQVENDYNIVLHSVFFGYKSYDEKIHKELCTEIYGRIPWRKTRFWLIDGTRQPIQKFKMVRVR